MHTIQSYFLILAVCVLCTLTVSAKKYSLTEALEAAAGVYKDPSISVSGFDLNNTVIVTATNFGYLNQAFNQKCFMDRMKYKYLILALDQNSSEVLEQDKYNLISYPAWEDGQAASTASSQFREAAFNFISLRKVELAYHILKLGYDLIFVDTDIPIINDFIPLLASYDDMYDLMYSKNHPYCGTNQPFDVLYDSRSEGNTGFYYVKSNIKTWDLWSNVLIDARKYPNLDDQTIFWNVFREATVPAIYSFDTCGQPQHKVKYTGTYSKRKNLRNNADVNPLSALRVCGLDDCLFSCSVLRFRSTIKTLRQRNQVPYVMHANFVGFGNEGKEAALFNHKMWLTSRPFDVNSVNCLPFDENAFYGLGN